MTSVASSNDGNTALLACMKSTNFISEGLASMYELSPCPLRFSSTNQESFTVCSSQHDAVVMYNNNNNNSRISIPPSVVTSEAVKYICMLVLFYYTTIIN